MLKSSHPLTLAVIVTLTVFVQLESASGVPVTSVVFDLILTGRHSSFAVVYLLTHSSAFLSSEKKVLRPHNSMAFSTSNLGGMSGPFEKSHLGSSTFLSTNTSTSLLVLNPSHPVILAVTVTLTVFVQLESASGVPVTSVSTYTTSTGRHSSFAVE